MASNPAIPAPPRWKRRAALRPEEILEAALAEFTENGFEAARMEDIARRAGISKAGVYLYFPSKDALLEALIEAKVAPFARQRRSRRRCGRERSAWRAAPARPQCRAAASGARERRGAAPGRLACRAAFRTSPNIIAPMSSRSRARRLMRLIEAAIAKGAICAMSIRPPSRALSSGRCFSKRCGRTCCAGKALSATPKN